jgi:GNAT superfamily N-acetyltransferase
VSYQIVRYTPEHKAGVLELQTHLWSPDLATNAAYFAWKYERNPYLDAPFIHLALHGAQVVGMRGMYGARWHIGLPSEELVGPCGADFVVAPDHRGHGLASGIVTAAADDLGQGRFAYAFSLSAGTVTQLALLTAGWRSVGSVERAVWRSSDPTRGDQLARANGTETDQSSPFASLDSKSTGCGEVGCVSLELAPRPDQMADLVERIGGDGRLRQVRDAQYFAWRYRNPLSEYRFLFWADARMEGYLVLQAPSRRARRPVTIVDWEASSLGARTDLLRAALRWGQFDEVTIWTAGLPAGARMILREAGFGTVSPPGSVGHAHRERASRQTILVSAARRDLPAAEWAVAGRSLLDPATWDLRAIDSDNF